VIRRFLATWAFGAAAVAAVPATAAERAEKTSPTYSVRTLWFDLQTRVGTTLRLDEAEFTIQEASEVGFPTKAAAEARAKLIMRAGCSFEPDPGAGRWQFVPAARVERVEVYEIP
jgi:hypothetical protein